MMVCSFCGKNENQVRRILYGGNGENSVICNECILASYNMLVESGDIKPGSLQRHPGIPSSFLTAASL